MSAEGEIGEQGVGEQDKHLVDNILFNIIISIWVTIKGGLVTRYRTKKIKFLDFLCSSDCSSIFFRIFSLIPNNASLQEVV